MCLFQLASLVETFQLISNNTKKITKGFATIVSFSECVCMVECNFHYKIKKGHTWKSCEILVLEPKEARKAFETACISTPSGKNPKERKSFAKLRESRLTKCTSCNRNRTNQNRHMQQKDAACSLSYKQNREEKLERPQAYKTEKARIN